MFRRAFLAVLSLVLMACSQTHPEQPQRHKIKLRLEWIPQAQFAGFIVADRLGYYKEAGIDVQILPAGPDLKPQVTVASGSDDIAIGVPNQVILARMNAVPLKIVAQLHQDSANRYVLKRANAITSLQQLRHKPVGLWLGGDEAEFISMLKTQNMTLTDVHVIPQEFSVIPFLRDKYVLSEVTIYNELNLIQKAGFGGNKLQILSPRDYNSAILGDMVFTTEDMIANRKEDLVSFLSASLRGWQYAMKNPEATVDILVRYNPELKRADQRSQLAAINNLLLAGDARRKGLGYMDRGAYRAAIRILLVSGQISHTLDANEIYDTAAWDAVPAKWKTP